MDVRALSTPLYQVKGWLKFVGVMLFIDGAMVAITGIGIVVAWIPIWLGVLCFKVSNAVEIANHSDSAESLLRSLSKIATMITIVGVVNIVFLVLFLFFIAFFGGLAGMVAYMETM